MHSLYLQGHSLAEVGRAFGVSRQTVFKMLSQRGLKLRSKSPPIMVVEFAGTRYTRRANGYFASTSNPRTYLHRDIYEKAHGPIPDGLEVHHKNEDKTDNRLGNLELMRSSDHGKLHSLVLGRGVSTRFKKKMG